MILDVDLVRRRRRDLGISRRQLAKHLGVTVMVVVSIEAGRNHHTLTLGMVGRLAQVLAVQLTDLVRRPDSTADSGPSQDEGGENDLVAQLGALLLETSVLTPVEALADALGTRLPAVWEALGLLDRQLWPAGLMIHRLNGDVAIRKQATTDRAAMRRLLRAHQARRGLSLTEARVLRRVMDRDLDEGKLSNPDQVALERLRKSGLVTDDRYPALTREVASGFAAVEERSPPPRDPSPIDL